MDKKLIVANWKMLPKSLAEAEGILEFTNDYLESLNESREFSLVFCPPTVFLEDVARLLKMSHLEHEASLGVQDIAVGDDGAMLKKLGVSYVIIGHSERRWKLGESDEIINSKLKTALRNELVPIVCIGEKTRDVDFKTFLEQQVKSTFNGLSSDDVGRCIIAYEPVWAISTNPGARPDTPESAIESIKIIKNFLTLNFKLLNFNFLYGGSVNSKNVSHFLKEKEINGVLIGGASVNKQEFVKILEISSQI